VSSEEPISPAPIEENNKCKQAPSNSSLSTANHDGNETGLKIHKAAEFASGDEAKAPQQFSNMFQPWDANEK
jgi:hypothetical protein